MLQTHLEQVLGAPVHLAPAKRAHLPAHIVRGYRLWKGRLVDHRVLFAWATPGGVKSTAKRIEADLRALNRVAKDEVVVIVLSQIEAHVRQALIQRRVPFIVPGRQLFLPAIGIALQERGLGAPRPHPDDLSWASQVTLLRHLLRKDVEGKSLRAVAAMIGYSAASLTNVQRELVATQIAEVRGRGRAHTLHFLGTPLETWKTAISHLRSPVRRATSIRIPDALPDTLHAGLSELSNLSDIADAGIPTVALDHDRAADAERNGEFAPCPDPDSADAVLEVWNYDPVVLARGGHVDRLSLYLSLRADPDARTQQAAEQLLDGMQW